MNETTTITPDLRPVHCRPGRRYRLCQNGLGRHYLSNAGRDSNKKG